MIGSPAITAILIAVLGALAFSGGFVVSNWRSASEIQRLKSTNAVLSAANDKCATDVQSVRMNMQALTAASTSREKTAAVAMRKAAATAARHSNRAKSIRALPPVAPEHQCDAIVREQAEYVESRRERD
ncbi:MAG: hypothetical protein H0X43_02870 [Nitrosospira sp.]|nr:hypothetical protein [Nitrosospira sp.]